MVDQLIILDQVVILVNDGFLGVWVVVNAPVTGDVRQVLMLNLVSNSDDSSLVLLVLVSEENLERGRLDGLCDVDNFFQSGHTKRHILGGDTGTMESVQRHLSGWFTHRLRSNASHHFTGMHNRSLESLFNGSAELIE